MKIVLLALFLLLVSPLATARIYKWIDASGVTQYSENPPPGGNVEEIQIAPKPSREDTDKAQTEARQLFENERRKKEARQIEDAKRKRECDRLRAILTQLRLPGPYSQPLEGGSVFIVPVASKSEFRKEIQEEFLGKCD